MSTVTEPAAPVKSSENTDAQNQAGSAATDGSQSPTTLAKSSLTPADFQVKHPLQDAWTWWFDNPKKKTNLNNWSDNLKKIYTFSTVEDFWSLWNNIKGAHELAQGSNYHLFKDGIEPKWEDPINARGGKWLVQIKPNQRAASLNQLWLWAVLACIGASFDDDSHIVGIVVSVRKQMDKISLWTTDATNEQAVRRIGRQFKEFLQLPASVKVGFQSHADAMDNNNSFANKNRYEV
jgi:translation initiation factor 4E